jgi:hypothetical protein
VDLDTVRADDALLDAIGHGDAVPEDDELAMTLGAWRADLDTEPLPAFDLYAPASAATSHTGAGEIPDPDASGSASRAGSGAGGLYASTHGRRRGQVRPRTVRLAVAAAVVIAAAGGVSVAAAGARPDSPLWPVTKIVHPQGANVRAARDAIAKARAAVDAGRYDDARRLIDQADALVSKVQDPQQSGQLREELDALRNALPSAGPGSGRGTGATPSPTAAPPTPTPSAAAGSAGAAPPGPPDVGSPVPQTPTPTGRGLLPPIQLPSLPPLLPSLPHL